MKNKRALTDEQKDEIMKRFVKLWKANDRLRLGQLIGNLYHIVGDPLYLIEDYDLIDELEEYYEQK